MAANYWSSAHRKHWVFTKDQLSNLHKRDKEQLQLTDDEIVKIKFYHITFIQTLGKSLGIRQRVVATAIVYFRRIYVKHNFSEFCPRLIAATALYIAAKAEETSTQAPAYKIVNEMKKIDPGFPYTTKDILDCELYILEALDFHLIIYHPYHSVLSYVADCKLEKTEMLHTVWSLLNDSYSTDLMLMYAPYVICLGCIYLASFLHNVDLRLWFSELDVNMKDVWSVSNELLDYYELRKKDNKQEIMKSLLKLPWYHK